MSWRTYLGLFFLSLVLAVTQVSFFPPLLPSVPAPLLTFSLALAFITVGKTESAYFSAFISGLLIDLMMGRILGSTAFLMLSTLILTSLIKNRFFDNFLVPILSTLGLVMAWSLIFFNNPQNNSRMASTASTASILFISTYAAYLLIVYVLRRILNEPKSI
jgi:cell shape-determining protein MreD